MTENAVLSWRTAVDEFQQAILVLDERMNAHRTNADNSVDDECELLVRLSNLKTQIAVLYDDQVKHLMDKMTETELVTLNSGETIEKKWSKDRKGWKHKDLASVVASRIENLAIDMDTGERVMSSSEMITKLLDFVQPSYWRVTALNEIGINADDFCEAGDSKPSLSIRKAN